MDIKLNTCANTYYSPYDSRMDGKEDFKAAEVPAISEAAEKCADAKNGEDEKGRTRQSSEAEKIMALNMFMDERLNEDKKAPYSHLAEDGVINYNGVQFICQNENQSLCLGDTSNMSEVIIIPLENGGCLMVNRNQVGSLSLALGMFSPADVGRIMRAIAQDNQCRRKLTEIETFEESADGVEEAWRQAAEEAGCDGFGYDAEGKKTHITQLDMARVLGERDESVLGKTVESALAFAENALDRLNNPLSGESDSEAVRAAKAGEKKFYESFIQRLKDLL